MLGYDWLIDFINAEVLHIPNWEWREHAFLELFSRWWHDKEGAAVASHLWELLWERKERSRM